MRIKFLGSGSAFVEADENYQSNVLFTKEDGKERNLLYDVGTTIGEALKYNGFKPEDIDEIFISHLHADHAGGMEFMGFKRYFGTFPFGTNIPALHAHHDTMDDLWNHTLKGGMRSLQGQTNTLETFFDTNVIPDNGSIHFCGTEFKLLETMHVMNDRRKEPSFGLIWIEDGKQFMLSGDAQYAPNQMLTFYEQSDVIFHDCEMMKYPQSVHAQFHELCTLSDSIRKKMWLYHYSLMGKTVEELEQEVLEAGFAGLVKRGQEFFTESM